jgi:heat-inducible transcriptional repressor
MGGARLSESEERMIAHQFHQVELNVSEWIRLAASVLASRVQNPVMVSSPVVHTARIRHLDFVKIGTGTILVVMVLQSGAVRQLAVRANEDVSHDTLSDLATEWNGLFIGRSSEEAARIAVEPAYRFLQDVIVHLLQAADREFASGGNDVQIAGISYMAGQPEFGSSERFQPILEALEHNGILQRLMEPLLQSSGVYVAIGEEQPIDNLRDCAVILATYGRQGEMLGVVGVIGPTRLPYWRTVPMVSFTAGILDQLLESTFLS